LGAKGLTKGERNAMEAERLANIKKRRAEYQREEGDVVGETRNIFESRIHEEGKGKEMQTTRMTPFKGYHLIADVEKRAIPNPNFGPTGKYIMKPVPEPTPERILNLNEEAVKFFDWLAKQPWVFANLSAGKVIKKKEEGAIRKFISDAITALSSTEDKQVKYNQLKNQNKDTVTKIYKNIGEEYKTKPGSKPKQAYNTLLPEGLIDNNIARAILDSHAEENLSQEHIKQLTSELKELLTVKTRGGALKTKQNKQFTKLNKKIKTKKAGKH
jgi:hypothetical protein